MHSSVSHRASEKSQAKRTNEKKAPGPKTAELLAHYDCEFGLANEWTRNHRLFWRKLEFTSFRIFLRGRKCFIGVFWVTVGTETDGCGRLAG